MTVCLCCGVLSSALNRRFQSGVAHAAKIYPNGYLIMILIGTVKGTPTITCGVITPLLL